VVVGNNSAFGTGAVVANAGNTATTVRNTQTRILNNTFVVDGNMSLIPLPSSSSWARSMAAVP
jgi:diaminopimelate decarboxylase